MNYWGKVTSTVNNLTGTNVSDLQAELKKNAKMIKQMES